MKALFIGGTGLISGAVAAESIKNGWDLFLLNRGNKLENIPKEATLLLSDINDEDKVAKLIDELHFDVVVDFIAFTPNEVQRDIRLFSNKTDQFIFISSASVYQKPLSYYKITESTPLSNPFWKYSQNKIACEDILVAEYRENGFPITIVRPSHTYGITGLPLAMHGRNGSFGTIDRIINNRPVIIPGDGSSLWTITHNCDFARAFVAIMGNSKAIGEALHITSDEVLSWNCIYDTIGKILGKEVKKAHVSSDFLIEADRTFKGSLLGDKAESAIFDNSKIKRLAPGFIAKIPFEKGARRSIDHILATKELQTDDRAFDDFCDKIIKAQELAVSFVKNKNFSQNIC